VAASQPIVHEVNETATGAWDIKRCNGGEILLVALPSFAAIVCGA
jgi:hypothetical protein